MSEIIKGKFEVQNANGSGTAIALNGNAKPQSGPGIPDTTVKPVGQGDHFIVGQLDLRDAADNQQIALGMKGQSAIVLFDNQGNPVITLDADERTITLKGPGGLETISLKSTLGNNEVAISPGLFFEDGVLRLGAEPNGKGKAGALILHNDDGAAIIRLKAEEGNLWLGGKGADGDLLLFAKNETDNDNSKKATIHLDGEASTILLRVDNKQRVQINGQEGNIWLGGNGADGDIALFAKDETEVGNRQKATIHLDGDAGDIVLRNADCAEEFDIAEPEIVEAGTVMVLDDSGQLRVSQLAYDKKVTGVVSGAGDYKPGIILDRQSGDAIRQPIALMGKVFCKVDARHTPVAVGDLLTTSATPGHAMKANDAGQAFGAVLGKALKPLTDGMGMIPVLVALQ